jgi:hypothetical protein
MTTVAWTVGIFLAVIVVATLAAWLMAEAADSAEGAATRRRDRLAGRAEL